MLYQRLTKVAASLVKKMVNFLFVAAEVTRLITHSRQFLKSVSNEAKKLN